MFLSIIFLTILFFLWDPAMAHAWGPATHLEYAGHALAHLTVLAPAVKKLLSKHENHFLYGTVAADITLGKDLRGYLYNCHNWRVALDLFYHKAKKDHQKAFMLGYLGHLAADTVAHNFFVPFKTIRSWNTKLKKHVYWEMRMDLSVPHKYWEMMDHFSGDDENYAEDDALLESHLKRTFFSFKTNKKIFNSLFFLQRARHYRETAEAIANKSLWTLAENDITNYKALAKKAIVDFLSNLENSFVLHADPTGKLKLLYARDMVTQIKTATKAGQLSAGGEKKLLHDIKTGLQTGIYDAVTLPSIDAYLGT